jgi:hypothetical protein
VVHLARRAAIRVVATLVAAMILINETGCAVRPDDIYSDLVGGMPTPELLRRYEQEDVILPADMRPNDVVVALIGLRRSGNLLMADFVACSTDSKRPYQAASVLWQMWSTGEMGSFVVFLDPAPARLRRARFEARPASLMLRTEPAYYQLSDGACGKRGLTTVPVGIIEQRVGNTYRALLVPGAVPEFMRVPEVVFSGNVGKATDIDEGERR